MKHTTLADLTRPRGTVRTLSQQEELPLLRDHLLRLDRTSRHDRAAMNGVMQRAEFGTHDHFGDDAILVGFDELDALQFRKGHLHRIDFFQQRHRSSRPFPQFACHHGWPT